MKNEDRFKTADERCHAYYEYAEKSGRVRSVEGFAYWLALEAEEEKPEPCPFCGKDVKAPNQIEQTLAVVCQCGYRSEWKAYVAEAIAAHNRVARAVRAVEESEAK